MADTQADGHAGDYDPHRATSPNGLYWTWAPPLQPWTPGDPYITPLQPGPYVPFPNTPYIPPITWPPLTPQPDVVLTTTTEPNMSRKAELVLLALVAMADRECRTVTIGFEDDESADVALKEGETFDEFVERVFHRLCNVRGRIPT